MDEIRGVARALGVVNTVAFERGPSGTAVRRTRPTRLVGYNTDVAGIVNALRHAGAAAAPTAVVLGGGGTAAAALAALKELGAPAADVFVRDVSRAAEARAAAAALGLPLQVLPIAGAAAAVAAADVVISTLPPRAADELAAELQRELQQDMPPGPARHGPPENRRAAGCGLRSVAQPDRRRLAGRGRQSRSGPGNADLPGGGAGPPLHRAGRGGSGRSHRCDV